MKELFITFLLACTPILCLASESSPYGKEWSTNYVASLKKSKKSGRPAFVYFSGSNWCGFCQRFNNQVLSTEEFKQFADDNLELVNLDFPRPAPAADKSYELNKWLQGQHGVSGFPTVLLLDSDGVVLLRTGYRGEGAAAFIKSLQPFCMIPVAGSVPTLSKTKDR